MNTQISFDAAVSASVKQAQINLTRNLPLKDSLYTSESMPASAQADKADRRESKNGLFVCLQRIAVIAVTVFFFAFSPMLTVHAVRDAISDTVIAWYDKYISVESTADSYPTQIKDFECGYMTDGFQFDYSSNYGAGKIKTYINGEKYINISVSPDDNTSITGLDNEYSKVYTIIIDDKKGLWMCSENNYNFLRISSEGVVYTVSGIVEIDEIINIYENIKIFL